MEPSQRFVLLNSFERQVSYVGSKRHLQDIAIIELKVGLFRAELRHQVHDVLFHKRLLPGKDRRFSCWCGCLIT